MVSPKEDGNGDSQNHEPLYRSAFRALVQDFSPIWFTWCMNAGIIAILLHNLPYQFNGLPVLSTIAFLVDFVLFILFTILFLTRFAWFGRDAYKEFTGDVNELALGACWPIAWMTIASLLALIVSNAHWGGHAFTVVAYVCWWFGAGWTLAYLVFTFVTLIRREHTSDGRLPPTILIPAVGVATVATTGGLVASYSYDISARLAVPIIVVAYLEVGIGMFMSIFLYTYLLHALLMKGWPPTEQIASMWLYVGPCGQAAAAMQLLSSSASTYRRFGDYNKGVFLTASAAEALSVVCIFFALLLTGLGILWTLVSVAAMAEKAWRKELHWNLTWNSIIFPTGTLATSFLLLSIEMDSPAFRVVTTALVIFVVLVFFLNLGFTIWEVSKGRLLIVKKNPRAERGD